MAFGYTPEPSHPKKALGEWLFDHTPQEQTVWGQPVPNVGLEINSAQKITNIIYMHQGDAPLTNNLCGVLKQHLHIQLTYFLNRNELKTGVHKSEVSVVPNVLHSLSHHSLRRKNLEGSFPTALMMDGKLKNIADT
jgi:hypothetical protein